MTETPSLAGGASRRRIRRRVPSELASSPEPRLSPVRHMVGVVLSVSGALLVVAAGIDVLDRGEDAVELAASGMVAGLAGAYLWRGRPLPPRARTVDAFGAVAASASVLIVLSTAVYLLTGTFERVDHALFESVAGLSTVALSVVEDVEAVPSGVLFWRAATQWIGGLGAVLLIVGVLPTLGLAGLDVTDPGRRQGTLVAMTPRARGLLRRLVVLYGALTAAGTVLYLAGGMTVFDAVTYAFTTISTGGFSNHPSSIRHFDSAALEWAAVGGMVLAGANLALLWRGLRGVAGSVLRSAELRAYAAVLLAGSLVLVVWTAPDGGPTVESSRHAVFTVASAVSTTGYTVTDWGAWAHGAQLFLLALVGIGSMSGSTGGGFRIVRALTVLAYVRREVVRQLHPRAVVAVKVGGLPIDDGLASRMIGHQALYVALGATGAAAIAAFGVDITTATSGAISALASFGPALGDLGPGQGALGLDGGARAVLIPLMLVGRLEIYPLLLGAGALAAAGRAGRRAA